MNNPNNKEIWVTWSGGIDSTGLIGLLLQAGWVVHPVCLLFGDLEYRIREAKARDIFSGYFEDKYPGQWNQVLTEDGNFLNVFSSFASGQMEIPRRNKHILDYIMTNFVIANNGYYVGMGEYIGADTWAVKDHVGAHDCDARYFVSYMLQEYGLNYRFMCLADFGESRYKADRVKLLVEGVGLELAFLTTNCMENSKVHCGRCYKCVERAVAFDIVLGFDETLYLADPRNTPFYSAYQHQMKGESVNLPWNSVNTRGELDD